MIKTTSVLLTSWTRWIRLFFGLFFCLGLTAGELPDAKRVLFLGDSITYGGRYIEYIETAVRMQHPKCPTEFLNVGLPSETVSGLSEAGHAGGKFPRPDVHERVDRVLEHVKPDLVVICYGMNCGIYHPLSPKRFKAFQEGMTKLREKILAAGAKVIHMTPPVFDPLPIKSRVEPDAGKSSYAQPYASYDSVLAEYSAWLMAKKKADWVVLDLHTHMKKALTDQRKENPAFTYASDGIHPNDEGHKIMAEPIFSHWGLTGAPGAFPDADKDRGSAVLARVEQKQRLLKDAWLTATGHKRPGMKTGLPLDEALRKARELDAEMLPLLK
jgi:lysophospholipase L1-like esterase